MADGIARHDDGAPDGTRKQPDSETARRAFIRKSAEVAAFSMFGVAGLDAVVEGVVREVGRLTGDRRMAEEAAEVLAEAGLSGRAEAECGQQCEPQWHYTCARSQQTFCLMPSPHQCDDQQQFVLLPCGGESGRWDCFAPLPDNYGVNCSLVPDDPIHANNFTEECANMGKYHADCYAQGVVYSCPEEPFLCDPTARDVGFFDCGWWGQGGTFRCGTGETQDGFECDGGALYDFRCSGLPSSFECGSAANSASFECRANHLFWCQMAFNCQGDSFSCAGGSTGTNDCNTDQTGVYNLSGNGDPTVPGDFLCEGDGGAHFQCPSEHFSCREVTDDFSCTAGFLCAEGIEPFNADVQCKSLADGHGFFCTRSGPLQFSCFGNGFTCSTPSHYAP